MTREFANQGWVACLAGTPLSMQKLPMWATIAAGLAQFRTLIFAAEDRIGRADLRSHDARCKASSLPGVLVVSCLAQMRGFDGTGVSFAAHQPIGIGPRALLRRILAVPSRSNPIWQEQCPAPLPAQNCAPASNVKPECDRRSENAIRCAEEYRVNHGFSWKSAPRQRVDFR